VPPLSSNPIGRSVARCSGPGLVSPVDARAVRNMAKGETWRRFGRGHFCNGLFSGVLVSGSIPRAGGMGSTFSALTLVRFAAVANIHSLSATPNATRRSTKERPTPPRAVVVFLQPRTLSVASAQLAAPKSAISGMIISAVGDSSRASRSQWTTNERCPGIRYGLSSTWRNDSEIRGSALT